MNAEKARELFSDHREGTLNENLRESFEAALRADSSLSREYSQFCELIGELEGSKSKIVEVPFDLHEKIMASVDKSLFEERRKAKTGWLSGWRLTFVGAAAILVVIGTVSSINNAGAGTATSDFVSVDGSPGLTLGLKDGMLYVRHGSAEGASVLVKDDATGTLVKRFDLNGNRLDSPLSNDGQRAVLLRVESSIGEAGTMIVVALPGKSGFNNLRGSGSVRDLAKAVANTYREPVQVGAKDPDARVGWSLDTSDATRSKASEGAFTIERRKGLLYLAD